MLLFACMLHLCNWNSAGVQCLCYWQCSRGVLLSLCVPSVCNQLHPVGGVVHVLLAELMGCCCFCAVCSAVFVH